MHIESTRLNLTKIEYLKKIVARITFLRLMYIVACLILNIMIENIKIKTMFNSEVEVNCIFK